MAEPASPDKKETADGDAGAQTPDTSVEESSDAAAESADGTAAEEPVTAVEEPVVEDPAAAEEPVVEDPAAAEEPAAAEQSTSVSIEKTAPVSVEKTEATPEAEAVESEEDADDAPPPPPREPLSARSKILAAVGGVLSVALILLIVFGVLLWGNVNDNDDDDDARKAAVAAAQQAMINLSSVNAATAEADVQRVLDSATGQFLAEFRNNRDQYIEIVKQAQVESTAEVDAAGIQNEIDDRYRVLVALTSNIKNTAVPNGEVRPFRMAATMVEQGGDWKVERVEYIS